MVDADIYGHSVPRMLGTDGRPTRVEDMIMPPQAHGVKVISIGMFTAGNAAVVWRGPMLHRALQQFLADVYWGDLDVLLLDLPPGTGDVAISLAQLLPNAEILVVTTPQTAAAEVAERAGAIALQTHQRLVGVVENMSWLELPDGSADGDLRLRRRRGRRRLADPHARRAGAAAGSDPAGHPGPRGRRRGRPDRAGRAGRPGGAQALDAVADRLASAGSRWSASPSACSPPAADGELRSRRCRSTVRRASGAGRRSARWRLARCAGAVDGRARPALTSLRSCARR